MLLVSTCLAPAAHAAAPAAAPVAANCDRTCLGSLLTRYIDALVAHDPAQLPVATGLRVTENSRDARLGEGLWQTVTAKHGFRQDYLDVSRQVAASHVVLKEGVNNILYTVLLHVKDQKITGIETLYQRLTPQSRFQPAELGKALPGMNDPVPAGMRDSRETMIRTALTYTEGLRIGSFVRAPTPFAKEAYRIENGMFMAGTGCPREQCPAIQTQKIMEHPDITYSVAAVDEENGVVLLWMNFGDTDSYGKDNALVTFEAFKVWGGEIHVVHAFFPTLPEATRREWPSSDAAPSLLEWRVQRDEDIKAIERVLVDYGRTLDRRDFAAYSALFAKEGEWKGGFGTFKGPANIKAAMEKAFTGNSDVPPGSNFHVMSNFIIDVKGDRATADSMFVFYRMSGSKPEPAVAGRYEDQLIREDGAWKFLSRNARNP
jgi:SnoaL-like domain